MVYTGFVDQLKLTDDEVAAFLAHEMIHLTEEHAKIKMGGKALTNLATKVGKAYVGETLFNIGKSYMGDTIGQLGGKALEFSSQMGVDIPYAAQLETTADDKSLMLMLQSGYQPKAAMTLWEKLTAFEDKKKASFLTAHPFNAQRKALLEKRTPELVEQFQSKTKKIYVLN